MAFNGVETLEFFIHNVFLPPKLPQSGDDPDSANASHEAKLLNIVIKALDEFSSRVHHTDHGAIKSAQRAMGVFQELRGSSKFIIEEKLISALSRLADEDATFPLHVSAQNAGIIITREQSQVRFESFELSPKNGYAMGTQGRLRRCFPASSVSIPITTYRNERLRQAIAHTITKMSHQEVSEAKPKIKKNGQVQIEERDTTDPYLVTDFLHTVLQAVGEARDPSVIWKNTREEVFCKDATLPWRRSPAWLLIRVALQVHFNRVEKERLYKEFMIFLMSYILKLAQKNLPSDFLYCMVAKIERRLIKLSKKPEYEYPWLSGVRQTLDSTWSSLKNRWKKISQHADPMLSLDNLSRPISEGDILDSYSDLDKFIDRIHQRQNCVTGSEFRAPWNASVTLRGIGIPSLEGEASEELEYKLLAFEEWVKSSLCNLAESHLMNEETCKSLAEAMESYHQHARYYYKRSPESLSIMLLTILELWVACDKSACARNSLLPEYSPEIPYKLLQSSILYSSNHLERLHNVESYLKRRHDKSPSRYSALSSFGEEGSFSVRYYAKSISHQQLKRRIEAEATRERERKKTEYHKTRQSYTDLRRKANIPHTYVKSTDSLGRTKESHFHFCCDKCNFDSAADNLSIEIHEWPLPSNELKSQLTIFELKIPSCFNAWRNATMFVIHDVLKCEYSQRREEKFKELSQYMPLDYDQVNRRLTVVSTTKSNRGTHRKGKHISTATEDDILLRNGMTYCLYDEQKRCLVSSFKTTDDIPRDCMYELSEQNERLQEFIFRPAGKENELSPNHVLSEQFSCSERLSLEEFKAMATLPIGFRLQWHNILVQLFNPTIDFNKPDAVLILMQVMHQAGPSLDSALYRASHNQLRDEEFVQNLFKGLSLQLHRIERNWESYVALKAFVCIAIKALNIMEASNSLARTCGEFMIRCRSVAIKWIRRLEAKIETRNDEQREEFYSVISQISLICISSFDIEEVHLENLLLQKDQASILIESAIIVKSLSHSVGKPLDPTSIGLTLQAKRVLYKSHRILIREVLECKNVGLDMAIKQRLTSFTRGSKWKSLSDMDYHWLEAKDLERSKTYHVNLLNGDFFVNGLPPSRLPSEYETHPNFGTLFGRAMIEVTSSSDPGMSFSATKPYQGYELLFGIDAPGPVDLLLMASEKHEGSQSPRKLELIPHRLFEEKLPTSFVNDYVHWYDRNSQTIEFRPKEKPWVTSSSANWVLCKVDSSWTLQKQGDSLKSLIGSRSPTAELLWKVLGTLEDRCHMNLIMCNTTKVVKVDMPRLRLQFYLSPESSKLQCRQYRGMYVDENQEIGALIGLRSKLTLRDDRNNRKILIPNGKVDYHKSSSHIDVWIEHKSSTRVHPYDVDTRLGHLVDNGSLASKLTLAYLHGLTSFCLPNRLTSKTGTEDCLSILQSAAVRSFQTLSGEDLSILTSISRLSPGRQYYPQELKVMETIDWDNHLSFLSQDVSLNIEVQKIIKSAASTQFFYQDYPMEIVRPKHVNGCLESRHQIRASVFHVFGYGAESHTTSYDVEYQGRDRVKRAERCHNAYAIALTVATMRKTLHFPIPRVFSDQLWKLLESSDGTKGPYYPLENDEDEDEVSYDSRWLSETESFLPDIWCRFHRSCGEREMQSRRFSLMFCLATMAYANDCHIGAIQALAAFANIAFLKEIEPPRINIFNLSEGHDFKECKLNDVVRKNLKSFYSSPESSMTRRRSETEYEFEHRRSETFTDNQRGSISKLLTFFHEQFFGEEGPSPVPKAPSWAYSSEYLYTSQIMDGVLPIWQNWYHNLQLFQYLENVVQCLQSVQIQQISIPDLLSSSPVAPTLDIRRGFINDADLFDHPPVLKTELVGSGTGLVDKVAQKLENGGALGTLVEFLRQKTSREFERRYLENLDASQKCRERSQGLSKLKKKGNELREELRSHLSQCEEIYERSYSLLKGAVGSGKNRSPGVSNGSTYMTPRISSSFFLSLLARARWECLPLDWKKAIVAYAISLTMVQRAERMFFQEQDEAALVKELLNPGHTNWDPMQYPESLLLEVESGIMIRGVQEEIAAHMRTPPNNKNSVMQLNMGEGKSSVIVPIVAAHLADGKKLVRVIVVKPQAKELLRTLISKLGGLMDHQIYHMPFSRQLRLNHLDAETVFNLSKQCAQNGGILLVQPEHLLSFQLMGIESQLNARIDVGQTILKTHQYFNTCSRDLVDESDENFNVKFELIYTMGTQTPIEFSPERWAFIQSVLRIVMSVIDQVQEAFPESIEVTSCIKGQFPRIRLLRKDAEERFFALIADTIFQTGLRGFPIHRQPKEVRESIRKYVLDKDLTIADIEYVEVRSGFFTESIKGFVLLLRGLLAEGVLGFALREKRWRVNYGLDLDRNPKTRVAVPYRAKDNPTSRSEFSHPDVVIVLTCLSYYYGGLSDQDLFTAFDHLLMTDQARVEYADWVQDAPGLDKAFHTLAGVTMKDQQQMVGEIFPHLSKSKSTIDYFLSHIVFAREMKEFPQKLSASGWDIGRTKVHPTTGFSGTCDSQELLPLDMEHLDLNSQRHTNALVAEYLLQQENDVVMVPKSVKEQNNEKHSNADVLLDLVISMEPPVQVILDVGAQILEKTNLQLAESWLERIPQGHKKEAVIFFDDNDDLCVFDRQGCIETLQTSPYCQKLDLCLVFLDEAHTRGTDLKLPKDYRAAVTLGARLTKDRLVQACMRMRKLGQGQSVVFCVSEEIRAKIMFLKNTTNDESKTTSQKSTVSDHGIKVLDVLAWTIWETFADLRRSIPIWASQGQRFENQKAIWGSVTKHGEYLMSPEKAELFLEDEAQSLENRYKPKGQDSNEQSIHASLLRPDENQQLKAIHDRCLEFGVTEFGSSLLSEEQERELSPEIVQERQIERPQKVNPTKHDIHPDVTMLIKHGLFQPEKSFAFLSAFNVLSNTTASQELDLSSFPDDIFATEDFKRTVHLVGHNAWADCYQRSVQWILRKISPDARHLIIISPYEAQELMPYIEKSEHVQLHVYAPLPSLYYKPLDDLQLHVVPPMRAPWQPSPRQRLLLNLFSGQLNFSSYDDYVETCKMTCLATTPTAKGFVVDPDGFIVSAPNGETLGFRKSPVKFLRIFLMAIRQQSDGNEKTHWGRILGGQILKKERDFSAVT